MTHLSFSWPTFPKIEKVLIHSETHIRNTSTAPIVYLGIQIHAFLHEKKNQLGNSSSHNRKLLHIRRVFSPTLHVYSTISRIQLGVFRLHNISNNLVFSTTLTFLYFSIH